MTPEPARDAQPGTAAAAAGQPHRPAGTPSHHAVKRTRIGTIWVAAGLFAVILLLLLVFILENGQRVSIGYFGAHGHLPLGVALLLAAVLGTLLVVIPGTGRVIQLRITARRHRRIDTRNAAAVPSPDTTGDPSAISSRDPS
jgi:uncharacterized integral membrane protein